MWVDGSEVLISLGETLLRVRLTSTFTTFSEHMSVLSIRTGSNRFLQTFFKIDSYFDRKPLVYTIEEIMLLLLILGRWMLPKGSISHEQLSQLLLVYFGIAFDIMELFYLFDEKAILANPNMQYVILSLWTFSLFQFVIVLTVVKSRRPRLSMETRGGRGIVHRLTGCRCCQSEVWGLLTTVVMQDGPFLVLRIYCLAGLKIFSYNLMFYTVKNILVVLLQFYRLVILILRCTRPGFDERPPPRAPSVEILGPAAPRNGSKKPLTAAAAAASGAMRNWSSQRSLDSTCSQKMLDKTNSTGDRLDRSGSQDFSFSANGGKGKMLMNRTNSTERGLDRSMSQDLAFVTNV
jgi:Transmembrane protein 26